jgi:hypothetical protein
VSGTPSRVFVVRRSPLARPLTAVVAAVLVAGALTACSGFSLDGGCDPVFGPGDASRTVTASGDVGETPAVEFPTPLIPDGIERSVLTPGEGEPIGDGDAVLLTLTIFDGTTGTALDGGQALITASDTFLGLGESLRCATPGTRLAVVGAPAELRLNGSAESVVLVLDIDQVFLGKANGTNQLPQDGMPTVVTAVDGTPGIAVGYATAPTETRTALIKAGAGAALADGDTAITHQRTWSWPAGSGTPTLGDDTWAGGLPSSVDISADTEDPLTAALTGAKVGSQLLIVEPGADGGAATIVVVDILGILAQD